MRAIELLETISTTEYGYWIKPDGAIIVVPYQAHLRVLADSPYENQEAALTSGWIRVVAYTGWCAFDFATDSLNGRTVRSMKKIIASQRFSNFDLRYYDVATPHSDWTDFSTTRRPEMLDKIDELSGTTLR